MMENKKIRITQIDENQSIFRENKVVLFGAGNTGELILELLRQFDVEVYAYCDNNKNLWGTLVNGIKVISPDELQELVRTDENVLVQISVGPVRKMEVPQDILDQIIDLGVTKYIFTQETYPILRQYKFLNFVIKHPEIITEDYISSYDSQKFGSDFIKDVNIEYMLNFNGHKDNILICMPPKTGDYTINATFRKNDIPHFNNFHRPDFFKNGFGKEVYKKLSSTLKIITAVRDPVAQHLSLFSHLNANYGANVTTLFQVITMNLVKYDTDSIKKVIDALFKGGGDAQALFDMQLEKFAVQNSDNIAGSMIQYFVTAFQQNIIDIMKEPFNKEKGYSIIKEDNIEVFVYQLEKLNDIVPELSEWVGVPFDSLVIDNMGESKWNGASYKQAQKELKFSGEYFDKCYNEPYVKHFYSEQDIEKFKNRWRGNIIRE